MNLMILDGNSILNRAFYGIRSLTAPDGTPTNAVYGFLAILQKLLDDEHPDGLCVAFDLAAPTFRHESYDGYKAQRKGMPDELAVQLPIIKDVLDAMHIKRFELEGYEADDIIGTVSRVCDSSGISCTIVTGDKDSFQLISDTTQVLHIKSRMGQTETTLYDSERFIEEYGFKPQLMVDLKALMGDSSDNIPGVTGVGEKTALELVRRYGAIDEIYADLAALDIKDNVRKKLASGEAQARMSYGLATICCDVPIEFVIEGSAFSGKYGIELYQLFTRLGFNRFIEKWGLSGDINPDTEPDGAAQTSVVTIADADAFRELVNRLKSVEYAAVYAPDGLHMLEICDGTMVYSIFMQDDVLLDELFSKDVKKITHNAKDLMRLLIERGYPAEGFIFDTALAAYLLEPTEQNYDITRISLRYLSRADSGVSAIYSLFPVLNDKLSELEMDKLYYGIELPMCEVLADMELSGFMADRQALIEFGDSLTVGIDALQSEIWDIAGEEFNINSPKQLGGILFDKLMLPHGKKTKTGWSTSADVLEKLNGKHPVVGAILEYRKLTKLKSTYADGLLKVIADDGRIHTSFQMTVTATGRLSSVEPNLQNIPIRSELGAKLRKMFVAPEGWVLADADYSQIELRLLAHISGDETKINAFLSGEDIHAVTASQVFGVPLNEVTTTQRSSAKAVNFGIVYGISDFSLAQDIGVSRAEAREYIDSYLAKYHGVRAYMHDIVEQAKTDGYVSTLFGRRRWLPELKSKNFNERSFGERVALNMPIQGTAADVIKLAMVRIHGRLKSEGLHARLILQVHDELIAECPEDEAELVCRILTEEMEGAAKLSIPLTAEAHYAKSWHESK